MYSNWSDKDYEEVLSGLFARSKATGKAAQGNLERGLKVRALVRPSGAKELLLWRDNDQHPSGKTFERICFAAGFLSGIGQEKIIDGHTGIYVKDRADWKNVCRHDWLPETVSTERSGAEVVSSECAVCGSKYDTTTKTTPKKGQQVQHRYNLLKIPEDLFRQVKACGPIPTDLPSHVKAEVVNKLTKAKAAAKVEERHKAEQAASSPAPDLAPWEDQPEALLDPIGQANGLLQGASEDQPAPSTSSPAPELRGECCGLCGHGVLQWDNTIECQLGWEAHDPPMSGTIREFKDINKGGKVVETKAVYKTVPAIMGHGELEKPLLAPQTKCMTWGASRWIPSKALALAMRDERARKVSGR